MSNRKLEFKTILGLALLVGIIVAILAFIGSAGGLIGNAGETMSYIFIMFCVGFFGTIIVELFLNMLRED